MTDLRDLEEMMFDHTLYAVQIHDPTPTGGWTVAALPRGPWAAVADVKGCVGHGPCGTLSEALAGLRAKLDARRPRRAKPTLDLEDLL